MPPVSITKPVSAATRKKLSIAARKRWAERREALKTLTQPATPKAAAESLYDPDAGQLAQAPQPSPGGYVKSVMKHAAHEIRDLRRRNEILAAKVDVIEIFAVAMHMRGGQGGVEADVAWMLDNAVNSLP